MWLQRWSTSPVQSDSPCIAGPGLLVRVLTTKYWEHLPTYRQTEIFARQDVSQALLSNWVDTCCRLVAPLDEALYRYVMNTRKLHTHNTPVPVLAPVRKNTKTGRICTYVRDDRNATSSALPAPWFANSPDRIRSSTVACSVTSCRQKLSLKKSPANYRNDYFNIIVGRTSVAVRLQTKWIDTLENEAVTLLFILHFRCNTMIVQNNSPTNYCHSISSFSKSVDDYLKVTFFILCSTQDTSSHANSFCLSDIN